MTHEEITSAINRYAMPLFVITLKGRDPVKGLFIKTREYDTQRLKNFWSIVTEGSLDEYERTHNADLARIFYGDSFIRIRHWQK